MNLKKLSILTLSCIALTCTSAFSEKHQSHNQASAPGKKSERTDLDMQGADLFNTGIIEGNQIEAENVLVDNNVEIQGSLVIGDSGKSTLKTESAGPYTSERYLLPTVFTGSSSYLIHILYRQSDAHKTGALYAMVSHGKFYAEEGSCGPFLHYNVDTDISILSNHVSEGSEQPGLEVETQSCNEFTLKLTNLSQSGTNSKVVYTIQQLSL
ncbi:MAG: hypothetical protein HQK83_17235 [Fibrobacteria bacterium]|nr:hypothetical protein [Fibrobacteria bacterium]